MGEPFRVKYGFAIGHNSQFNSHTGYLMTGTAGLVKQAATTVDVTAGVLFYTNNTASTTITALTCNTYSYNTGNQEGRIVRIVMIDNSTQFAQTGNIVLSGSGNFGLICNATLDLMNSRGKWHEVGRKPELAQDYYSANLGTTTVNYVNADGYGAAFLLGTAATATLQSVSGGYIGQTLDIVLKNSAGVVYTINTGGNITFMTTSGVLTINTGAAFRLIKQSATQWYLMNPPTRPNA